jgi:hypothetical protein
VFIFWPDVAKSLLEELNPATIVDMLEHFHSRFLYGALKKERQNGRPDPGNCEDQHGHTYFFSFKIEN